MLPKAQDDPTTVDEAILAAVASHNDDPTAHMAAGQSIDVHRANTVIDHPAGSVLSDKLPQARFISSVFESLDGWGQYKTGTGFIYLNFPGIVLQSGATSGGLALVYTGGDGFSNFDAAKSFFMKMTVVLSASAGQTVRWGIGADGLGDGFSGCGFKVVGGTLYGYYIDDSAETTVTLSGVTVTTAHVYEIRYDAAAHQFVFWIDGGEAGSLTHTFTAPLDDVLFMLLMQSSASGAHNLYVADVVAQLAVS